MTSLHIGPLHLHVTWPERWKIEPPADPLLAAFRTPCSTAARTIELEGVVDALHGFDEPVIRSIETPGWTLDQTESGSRWTLPNRNGGWFWQLTEESGRWRVAAGQPLVDRCSRGLRDPLCYPLDQIVTIHEIVSDGGLLLHAAGFRFDREALVAPGVSGAGKTTLSRLISTSDLTMSGLSDDRILVAPRDGKWIAWGTPWAGEGRIAQQDSAPLRHLVFLEHAGEETLEGLEPQQALDHLLPAASIPWYDPERAALALANAASLVESVPCHRLRFRPVAGAVELLSGLFPQR